MHFHCSLWTLFSLVFARFKENATESANDEPAPYYSKTKYFWSFDGPVSVEENLDVQYIKGMLDNGIRLSNDSKGSVPWLDLGSINFSCISKPYECHEGFTLLFWAKMNGGQVNKIIVNAAKQEFARGIHLRINQGKLRFSTTGLEGEDIFPRTVQRYLDTKWGFRTWMHVGLVWNVKSKEMKIFYNCSEAEYTAAGVTFDRNAHVFDSSQRFIVGADNEASDSAEVEIDELGIWDQVLTKEVICHVYDSRRVHGKYSEWSKFTRCSLTCGQGLKTRTRTCTNPSPRNGGRNCSEEGPSKQTKTCIDKKCPIHGGYSQWGAFNDCSRTCSGGQSIRIRTCTQPTPQYGDRDCSALGPAKEIRVCNLDPCPVHGEYSAWSSFTSCTKSCENGTMSRNRSCDNPTPHHNGRNCSALGPSFEMKYCNEFPCPIHGGFSQWSSYSACSLSCGGGERRRARHCNNPAPLHGGKNCNGLGSSEETRPCNTQPCPIHGGYTAWSVFTSCSKSCNSGIKWRTRHCTNPKPDFGGKNCSELGKKFERILCNTQPCPVDGKYTQWSSFSPCSTTCNNGTLFRTRTCTNPSPKYSGRNCGHLGPAKEVRLCNMNECPINGNYGPWGPFSDCSASCGDDGLQIRTRSCDTPAPRFGGRNCSNLGPAREVRACNIIPCPIDGAWGPWSNYSPCSKTCERGNRFRTRECNNPVPQHGGRNCTTVSIERGEQRDECNTQLCPDIIVKVTVNMTSEEWQDPLAVSHSEERQRMTKKLLKNIETFYGTNSSLRKFKVLDVRKGSVLAVLELRFFNRLYSGVMNLQDEIFLRNRLGRLQVAGIALESIDVPSGPPMNITAYNTSSESIMISWGNVPVPQTNGDISGFTVLYSAKHNTTTDYNEITLDSDVHFLALKGLEVFHPYLVRILARNRRGEGISSLPEEVWTDMEAPNAAPKIQTGFNLSSTSIFIRWSGIPSENIRGILKGFSVRYRLVETGQVTRLKVNASSRDTILRNLKKFSDYEINLAGFNRKGSGPESQTIQIKTDEDAPSKPPENVQARNSSSTSLVVSWKPIPADFIHGNLRGYFVFYKTEYSYAWRNMSVAANTYSVELSGLRKYQKYHVQVAGFTRKGIGKPFKQLPVMTDEDVPSRYPHGILAVNTSSTSILVEWDPISTTHVHGILQGYVVYYKRRALKQSTWKVWRVSPLSRATEITNLRKFTKYNIRVAGYTSKGVGVRSPTIVAVTAEDVPSRPVQFVRAKHKSSTSLSVSWGSIPRPQLHGILRGYKILYRVLGDSDEVYQVSEAIPFQRQIELRGLLKFTTYGIRVVGFTIGDGTASEEITVTTDQDRPSRPPQNVQVRSRWSSSAIPLSWQPITPRYYVHGILRGYYVKYKPMKNSLRSISAPYKWITVSADTLGITLEGLELFTTYGIQVLAFTSKGHGVASDQTLGETCSCQRMFTTNWWKLTPYAGLSNGTSTGIFPSILQKAIEMCCSDCSKQSLPELDFLGGNNSNSLKNGVLEVNANIDDNSDFHFPIHGFRFQRNYGNGLPYVPLVQSPGAAFIISSTNQYNESDRVMKLMLTGWPLMIVLFLSSYVFGLIMWLIERKSNSKYFPTSFLYGPLNGLWWAFITVTTVGYGDKTPKTVFGRFLAILWTLTGQAFVAMFVAQVTSKLSAGIIGTEVRVYGKKIAAIQNSSEYRLGIKKNARYDPGKSYSNLQDIYENLVSHKVFGSLIDTYTVASEQELFSSAKLTVNQIFDYSLNYGVVLGGHARKLQPCLQKFVSRETEQVFQIVTANVKPLKNVLTRNVRVDQIQSFFDADTATYKNVVVTCAALFGCLALTGFIGQQVIPRLLRQFRPLDTNAVIEAREKAIRSQQEQLKDLMGKYTQDMKTTLLLTKQRQIKEMSSYIKLRKKAEKAINRSLKKTRNEKMKKKGDERTGSADDISCVSLEGSVKKETEVMWKDIEPLEGLFSLV